MKKIVTETFVAVGSNQSLRNREPFDLVVEAISLMSGAGFSVTGISRPWRTRAVPEGSGPDFVNAVVRADTPLLPDDALAALQAIEVALGRERLVRWGPRTLDLDLLSVGDRVLPDRATVERWMALPEAERPLKVPDQLILPHPRIAERAFVLAPLCDIAPGWRHPITGARADALLAALPEADRAGVHPGREALQIGSGDVR